MNVYKPLFAAIVAALALSSTPVFAGNGPGQSSQSTACPSVTTTQISTVEAQGLAFMREEEKLARDVYQALGAHWQAQVFNNIVYSEQTHMDQVKCLLDAFGLPDSASTEDGRFNNTALQSLYDTLMAQGKTSLVEALKVGTLIEETDIIDLKKASDAAQAPEIKVVYANLLSGSENHLRAFSNALAQQGVSYSPQVLDNTTTAAILTATTNPGATPPEPVVFDMNRLELQLPYIHLRLNGGLLPDSYRARLRLGADGRTFEIVELLPIQR